MKNRIHPPLIPGHEFCGEVAAFGDEVTSVKEGDFVSAEMHVACGKCLQCRTGEAHICQNVKIIGVDADGAFAEYVVIRGGVLVPVLGEGNDRRQHDDAQYNAGNGRGGESWCGQRESWSRHRVPIP